MSDNNKAPNSFANLEQAIGDATIPEDGSTAQDTRASIHVRSYRKLDSDPDGISAKAAIDGIVARGILSDDSSKQVAQVSFETVKDADERTEIIIINCFSINSYVD